jgi:hypothetical protein
MKGKCPGMKWFELAALMRATCSMFCRADGAVLGFASPLAGEADAA